MNDDVNERPPPQAGAGAIATILVLFGGMTIAMNVVAYALSLHDVEWLDTAIGLLCGVAAFSAGIMIRRGAAGARFYYLVFCMTMIAYWVSILELLTLYAIPGFALALLVLIYGYRQISRQRQSKGATEP
jgi:hypothetical protein